MKHLETLIHGTTLRMRCCDVLREMNKKKLKHDNEESARGQDLYEGEILFRDFYNRVYVELVEPERQLSKEILKRALVGTQYRDVVDFNLLSERLQSKVPQLKHNFEFVACRSSGDENNCSITSLTYMPVSASVLVARTDGTICVHDLLQEQDQGGDALKIRLRKNETALQLLPVFLCRKSSQIPVEYVVSIVGHVNGTRQIRTWRVGRTRIKITKLQRDMEQLCAYTGVNEAMRRTSQHAFESYWKRELESYFIECSKNRGHTKHLTRINKINFETLIVRNTISATESLMTSLISSPDHNKYVEDVTSLFESIRRDLIRHGGLESTLFDRVRLGPFLRALRAASKFLPNLILPVLAGDTFLEQIRKQQVQTEARRVISDDVVIVTKNVLKESIRRVLNRRVPLERVVDYLRFYRKKYFPSIRHLHRHLESCESGIRYESQDAVVAFDSKSLSRVLVSLDPWAQLENRFQCVRRHLAMSHQVMKHNRKDDDDETLLTSYVRRIACFDEMKRRVEQASCSVRASCPRAHVCAHSRNSFLTHTN